MGTIIETFPDPQTLLDFEPEELGLVLIEFIPAISQNGMFSVGEITAQMFPPVGPRYAGNLHRPIELALAESVSWLMREGLVIQDPGQSASWLRLTRRALKLQSRADIDAYRAGHNLPTELLQPILIEKVQPLFVRGDHDTAVFQAFRQVEIAVRTAANKRNAGYPDDLVGVTLMRRAFHPEGGSLTDATKVPAEREAQAALFAGAIGHCKNPPGHRDVQLAPKEAARLIVFASHLLDLVERA